MSSRDNSNKGNHSSLMGMKGAEIFHEMLLREGVEFLFGYPGATVVDVDGDGSFCMTMVEVMTAVRYGQPAKFIVLDNGYLGMVRQWQQLFWNGRYSAVDHPCPDFARIAEAYGAKGLAAREPRELEDAMAAMLRHDGPAVLAVHVEPEENVYPMVPAGKALHEMELGPAEK